MIGILSSMMSALADWEHHFERKHPRLGMIACVGCLALWLSLAVFALIVFG